MRTRASRMLAGNDDDPANLTHQGSHGCVYASDQGELSSPCIYECKFPKHEGPRRRKISSSISVYLRKDDIPLLAFALAPCQAGAKCTESGR